MSIQVTPLQNPFYHLSDEFVQKAIEESGFDPELEMTQSEIIKFAGLIYDPDNKNTAWIHYHNNKCNIPISLKHPNIWFSHIFSQEKLILSKVISALVECTKLYQSGHNLSTKQQAFIEEVTQVAARAFECLAQAKTIEQDIAGLFNLMNLFSREYKKIEFRPSSALSLPSTYTLQIHRESGHLIGISPIHVVHKMWQLEPIFEFMSNGLNIESKFAMVQPSSEFSFIIIAYKHELANPELTKTIIKDVKTVEAPYESIFKLPIRGHKLYEEMMAVKLSAESINETRALLGLEPFSEKDPLCFPFAYIQSNKTLKIHSLEEYMNVPGLEKYRDIVSAQVEEHIKRTQFI